MRVIRVVYFVALLSAVGCGKFFVPPTSGCTTNCNTTGGLFYVANSDITKPGVAALSISSSGLSQLTGSPYAVSILPISLAVDPQNRFLYVGDQSGAGIFLYTIGSTGALTLANNNSAVATAIIPQSMQVDSTGAWLIAAEAGVNTVQIFAIGSDGTLTTPTTGGVLNLATATGTPSSLFITPSNNIVYVTLQTGGVEILTFDATAGALSDVGHLATRGGQNADIGVTSDPATKYLFITETGSANGVRAFTIGTNGALANGKVYATGTGTSAAGPSAVLVDKTGAYVYVANRTTNNISGFTISNTGVLTAITGSPFTAGTAPIALAEDNTKTYIAVISSGGSPDLQTYTFDATTLGKLDPFKSIATGNDPTSPAALATTF
jgi:6-phosphogluconolactonase